MWAILLTFLKHVWIMMRCREPRCCRIQQRLHQPSLCRRGPRATASSCHEEKLHHPRKPPAHNADRCPRTGSFEMNMQFHASVALKLLHSQV